MISHLNKKNKPTIVDISSKKITDRMAIAEGIVKFSKSTYKKIESLKTKKGEIKSIAIIAGILGAKKTSDVIPLCHNIKIENIDIDIQAIKKISSLKLKVPLFFLDNLEKYFFIIENSFTFISYYL